MQCRFLMPFNIKIWSVSQHGPALVAWPFPAARRYLSMLPYHLAYLRGYTAAVFNLSIPGYLHS